MLAWRRRHRQLVLISVVLCAHLLGAISSVQAVMDTRTPQGAVAWIVSLNTIPYVAVPAYWVFGRAKFKGDIADRRADLAHIAPTATKFFEALRGEGLVAADAEGRFTEIQKLAHLPVTIGNDAELLIDGRAVYDSIFAGMEKAREYILVQFYTLRDDGIGGEFKRRLIDRARAGVRVYVLYDEVGSGELDEFAGEMRAEGITIRAFDSTKGPTNQLQLNFRNHRKIVVVDGRTSWIGGANVGDEYLGHNPELGMVRDTHVKITGPAVQQAQLSFIEDLHWAVGTVPPLTWDPQPAPSGVSRTALCVPSGPSDEFETCTLFHMWAVNSARKRLWIATPYFVPDEQFISALQLAALRGVDVRIIIPKITDNKLVKLSAWTYVEDLHRAGVTFFEYQPAFMHQKVMLVDDDVSVIGTANFDNRSFRLNFEVTMVFFDEDLAGQTQRMLEQDLADSRVITIEEVQARSFWERFGSRAARLMAPIL
ncbi:MAG: cardiolipin synthase [Phycisphaerae bacterium]|nr:cardiolipin synthase [Phycisphaerae bacterium]